MEQSFIGVDAEAGGLLFDPSVTEFDTLQAGQVVVLAGLGIGRVEGVETSATGELLVKLGDADFAGSHSERDDRRGPAARSGRRDAGANG